MNFVSGCARPCNALSYPKTSSQDSKRQGFGLWIVLLRKDAMRPSAGFAMEKEGDCDNDHSLGSPTTSTGRDALEVPTQASYLGGDRGGRSPPAENPGEVDRSVGHRRLSCWDPGQRALHRRVSWT